MTTTVYSGRVTNWPLFWLMNVLVVALIAFSGAPDAAWPVVIPVAVVLAANLTITSVRTTAGPKGVAVRYGVLGLPRFRYPLARIARAESIDLPFSRMGGWGIHWSPWRGTRLTIRSGPSLRLHLLGGAEVTISADDPDSAVAVLNGLTAGHGGAQRLTRRPGSGRLHLVATSGRHAAPDTSPHGTRATAEHARLAEAPESTSPWRLWGPYLSGRQWGCVREDYSADGDAWAYFPFDQSHARAYRWGEDGLGGVCDRFGFLNVAVALWNGRDPVLKERLFGLTNGEGNHGEDAKEYWWALDGTPTHSWMRWLYRYPQAEFPYEQLRQANAARSRDDREYELADTGVLDEDRFFDVTVTYAKAAPDDLTIEIAATNHGPDPAPLHLLPQVWFRNTWAWGRDDRRAALRRLGAPQLTIGSLRAVECDHDFLGRYVLAAEGSPDVLVCDNETNAVALFGAASNPTRLHQGRHRPPRRARRRDGA